MKSPAAIGLILIVVLQMGCASSGQQMGGSANGNLPARGTCNADGTAWAIGQPADQNIGRRLLNESGAGLWRIITPNQSVLKDYRDDRLNVNVDAKNIITSVSCG